MSLRVTRAIAPLDALTLTTREDMREIGLLVRERILRRTMRGLDSSGRRFAPLSPGYAKAKAKAGLPPEANLQVSGEMLNSLTIVDVTDRRVVLGFVR